MGFPVFPLEWKTAEGKTFSGYREEGYFPDAVLNMLVLLGWNPGTEQEIFSLKELANTFDLSRVNKSGAKFDPEKTKWFQHHYLQEKNNEELAELFLPVLDKKLAIIQKDSKESLEISRYSRNDNELLKKVVGLLKERATFVSDFWEQGDFFFIAPKNYNEKASKKAFKEDTPQILQNVIDLLNDVSEFNSKNISEKIKDWIASQEMGFGKVMMPLRLALVGEMKGPDIFEIASVLGKQDAISRIEKAVEFIG